MEEKALEGRTPTRVRFDHRVSVYPRGSGRSFPLLFCWFVRLRGRDGRRRLRRWLEPAVTDKPLESRRFAVGRGGEWQERRGPERGTAGRQEQDPEGTTPWMLGGRRAVIKRECDEAAVSSDVATAGSPAGSKPPGG